MKREGLLAGGCALVLALACTPFGIGGIPPPSETIRPPVTHEAMAASPLPASTSDLVSTGQPRDIAFLAHPSGDPSDSQLFVVDTDGTGLTHIDLSPWVDQVRGLSWFPDGKHLLIQGNFQGSGFAVISADGERFEEIRLPAQASERAEHPRVSPDGRLFAYERRNSEIWLANIDGSEPRKLTDGREPSWGPETTQVLFTRESGIHVINADGTGLEQLTEVQQAGVVDAFPVWSPAHRRILFGSNRVLPTTTDGLWPYVMGERGSGIRFIGAGLPGQPPFAWSPDGNRIIFTMGRSPTEAVVHVMNASGSEISKLMAGESLGRYPAWRPEPASVPDVSGPDPGTGTRPATPGPSSAADHLTPGQELILGEIHMATEEIGWAFGGRSELDPFLLRTTNGGESWAEVSPDDPALAVTFPSVRPTAFFLDSDHAWLTYAWPGTTPAELTLWRTSDGGTSWEANVPPAIGGAGEGWLGLITFIDPNTGWFVSQRIVMGTGVNRSTRVLRTRDGGRTWLDFAVPGLCEPQRLAFFDPRTGWLAHSCSGPYETIPPTIATTFDGGATWDYRELPLPDDQSSGGGGLKFCEATTLNISGTDSGTALIKCYASEYMVGDSVSFLYWTDDGWQTTRGMSELPSSEVLFLDDLSGWSLGREIYRTVDGGRTWEFVKALNWDGQFSFVDETLGWAIARNEDEIAFVRTTNGGQTWIQLSPQLAGP